MKNHKYILIFAGIILAMGLLRSCDTTWNPISKFIGMKADTVRKTEYKEILVPVPQIRIDTVRATRYVTYPVYTDTTIYKLDSSIVAQRDSLTLLLAKHDIKINAVCDTTTPAKDSLPWIHFHTEYSETGRVFHSTVIDIKPVHYREPITTTTITNNPKFTIGVGGGYGINTNSNLGEVRLGWSFQVQATYNIWSY